MRRDIVQTMKNLYDKIISFINALIEYFDETNNTLLTTRILYIRHNVKNVLSREYISKQCRDLIAQYGSYILEKNSTQLLKINGIYNADINLIWNSSSIETKQTIWNWLELICDL